MEQNKELVKHHQEVLKVIDCRNHLSEEMLAFHKKNCISGRRNTTTEGDKTGKYMDTNALEKEKCSRQDIKEMSLYHEQEIEREKSSFEKELMSMKACNKRLLEKVKDKEEIIRAVEESFQLPKLPDKKAFLLESESKLETSNRYSALLNDDSICIPTTTITVQALVHEAENKSQKESYEKTPVNCFRRESKRNLLDLSDSHGRGLSHVVDGQLDDFSVTVLSMPGAKLKHIRREGHSLAKNLCSSDCVVIITTATKSSEPVQLTPRSDNGPALMEHRRKYHDHKHS
ncbi:hypothetical protein J6590_075190 [Homalodisca vitripennis]|nr:hypothetical protein J6590_075190 [Homalodisca vitripennis]